jgi:hypothetical protein
VLIATATLTLVASLGLGTARQRQWHGVPRVAVRARGTTDRGTHGASGGPSVLAFVLVACRGPSRQRRGAAAARVGRNRGRRGRAGSGRRLGTRRTRALPALAPRASVAALVERALLAVGSIFESGWAGTNPPVARG